MRTAMRDWSMRLHSVRDDWQMFDSVKAFSTYIISHAHKVCWSSRDAMIRSTYQCLLDLLTAHKSVRERRHHGLPFVQVCQHVRHNTDQTTTQQQENVTVAQHPREGARINRSFKHLM